MSLDSWKREFYPIPASTCAKKNALTHTLRKYLGTRRPAMKRHGVERCDDAVANLESGDELAFGHQACALCKFYYDRETHQCRPECPVITRAGKTCCEAGEYTPFEKWLSGDDPEPMIRALRRAIKKQEAAK